MGRSPVNARPGTLLPSRLGKVKDLCSHALQVLSRVLLTLDLPSGVTEITTRPDIDCKSERVR